MFLKQFAKQNNFCLFVFTLLSLRRIRIRISKTFELNQQWFFIGQYFYSLLKITLIFVFIIFLIEFIFILCFPNPKFAETSQIEFIRQIYIGWEFQHLHIFWTIKGCCPNFFHARFYWQLESDIFNKLNAMTSMNARMPPAGWGGRF